jgi:hypothetical protein
MASAEYSRKSARIDQYITVAGDLPGVSGLKWRRPLAETNDGIHIVALLEMGIQVHWAVENVLSYSTRP